MHILILGAGGIGGYFGAHLVQAGANVSFLVRPARARSLADHGLRVESPLGDLALKVHAVTAAGDAAAADIVMLGCKAYDLPAAIEAIAPAVRPGTAVLPLLNGIAHLAVLAERFPRADHWGGTAHIAVTLTGHGIVRHLNRLNSLLFGPLSGAADARAQALAAALAHTPVDARVRDGIRQDLWDKFVFLATLAGMTCMLRAAVGTILAADGGEAMMRRFVAECAAVAAAEGYPVEAGRFADFTRLLTQAGSPMTASMLRDIERGGATEGDHILGDLLRRGQAHALPTPLLEVAALHLRVHEAGRRPGG